MSIFLSLGSNVSPRKKNIQRGLELLLSKGIDIISSSNFYKSKAMYVENQKKFFNKVIEVDTEKKPFELLLALKLIEYKCKRNFLQERNGPRTLDIDILCYKKLIIKSKLLTIPHKGIRERKFILKPWSEISPNYLIYGYRRSIKMLLNKIES